ncbi:hypothetical protein GQ54DRAFT_61020 [Martensiomyces pterosporus]|nr:hypothetical protein GQ54DRAFT_61020 [Martensiomyces pterosporus]
MALLDGLPLDILLAVVKGLKKYNWHAPVFYEFLPVASVNTSLRRSLLPLLYRDLVFEFLRIWKSSIRHNASLARSAGCSKYAQRVTLLIDEYTDPDDIVKAVRDDMDAGSETKWPNLRSYAYIYTYENEHLEYEAPCSYSNVIKQLDKELPKLRQAFPVACKASSSIPPLVYHPPSVSLLTQLTSLCLEYDNKGIAANRLPPLFAPTLVDLTLEGVNPENVWNTFYDGHKNQTVVFVRLKRLDIRFRNPLYLRESGDLPHHLQDATSDELIKRSVWIAGAANGKPSCRIPLFPALRTIRCTGMAYNFHDFISRTQCHDSLESLYVNSGYAHFDFDVKLFKNLKAVEFNIPFPDTNEERTSSVNLYKSAFTSLLRTKTNMQRMVFRSTVRDTLFLVPPDIGCTNLRSLLLSVEVDFKSMLRLLSNLKYLVKLELDVTYTDFHNVNDGQEDMEKYIDELQPPQADYPPVSSTLRLFICRLNSPRVRRCYTAPYAFVLALHLPKLETMTLGVNHKGHADFFEALLDRFLEELSGSPYMNDGLLNAEVIPYFC